MKKVRNRNTAYKILWPLVYVYFTSRFHPKYIGDFDIPKDGPIIVCSNHIHTHDQFVILAKTKRVVHYMAKKEYFDSKFGWFFKIVGCISVNRSIKDENAKSEAIDVLENGGALGLFPEGTRNVFACKEDRIDKLFHLLKEEISKEKIKKVLLNNDTRTSQIELLGELKKQKKITYEEYKKYVFDAEKSIKELFLKKVIDKNTYEHSMLLPFKFGVVSMAQKTNATIIPFGMYGKYKFIGGSLKAKAGKPFKVGEMTLEEANEKLYQEIKNIIFELKNEEEKNEK